MRKITRYCYAVCALLSQLRKFLMRLCNYGISGELINNNNDINSNIISIINIKKVIIYIYILLFY